MTTDSRDATCGTKRWTGKKPKVDGWYWVRDVTTRFPEVVYVISYSGVKKWVQFSGTDEDKPLDNMKNCEWQGPIHPEE